MLPAPPELGARQGLCAFHRSSKVLFWRTSSNPIGPDPFPLLIYASYPSFGGGHRKLACKTLIYWISFCALLYFLSFPDNLYLRSRSTIVFFEKRTSLIPSIAWATGLAQGLHAILIILEGEQKTARDPHICTMYYRCSMGRYSSIDYDAKIGVLCSKGMK